MVDFLKEKFASVIKFDETPTILDLSQPGSEHSFGQSKFTIGKYNEKRGIYNSNLFKSGDVRDIHLGIDIGAPVGTPVCCPFSGEVFKVGYNPAEGDYGYCLITRHEIQGHQIFFLFGHLSKDVLQQSPEGKRVVSGDIVGRIGDVHENGGWPPHLHFQLSYVVRNFVAYDLKNANIFFSGASHPRFAGCL